MSTTQADLLDFIILLPGPAGPSGFPEVDGLSKGHLSPPHSPSLAVQASSNELASHSEFWNDHSVINIGEICREGSAHNIREECERLFCETMRVAFLGEEGKIPHIGSYVMDAGKHVPENGACNISTTNRTKSINAFVELWDYVGRCNFRGFVVGEGKKKDLFIFFDSSILQKDLKQGLLVLFDLAEEVFDVSRVVICLGRSIEETSRKSIMKNLRWVGFEPITLNPWINNLKITSEKWLFLGLEM